MGMFDFKRCDGFAGCIPQHFIDSKFPKCPMCGTNEPYWKLKDKMEMMGNRTMFLCDKCGAILSATTADLSGMSSNKASILTTLNERERAFRKIMYTFLINTREETHNVIKRANSERT